MTTAELLDELRRRDVQLRVDGERLRVNAPAGTMTPDLQELVRARKTELMEFLRNVQRVKARQPALVPLQSAGTRWPIFGVPGHNGDIFCYRHLAKALGNEQPFYGLQPTGLDQKSVPMERVEDIAAYFAAQIREADATQPCVIVGFCAGGGIALELARQLTQQGHRVALLALFGTPFPTDYRWLAQQKAKLHNYWTRVCTHFAAVLKGGIRGNIDYIKQRIQRRRTAAQVALARRTDPVLELHRKVEAATMRAVQEYSPGPYDGEVVLFLPSEEWLRVGSTPALWRRVAKNLKQEVGPPTCNGDLILREQHAGFFGELLARYCSSLQRS